jgi:mono/diheme cytochrome c family protein
VAAVCTSKMNYTGGNGQTMRPGVNCGGCHNFAIAGTVYPTAHEPDNCIGVNGTTGVKVVITGSTGTVLTLTPNTSGNFYSNTKVTAPFTVKLTNGANTRMMVSPQTSGLCNSCHTANGANAAPGRVMSP